MPSRESTGGAWGYRRWFAPPSGCPAVAPSANTDGTVKSPLPCPPRALRGGYLRSFTANHGHPKPAAQKLCPARVMLFPSSQPKMPPAGLGSGMVPGLGLKVEGHQLRRDTRSGAACPAAGTNQPVIISTLYLPETTANLPHQHVLSRSVCAGQT